MSFSFYVRIAAPPTAHTLRSAARAIAPDLHIAPSALPRADVQLDGGFFVMAPDVDEELEPHACLEPGTHFNLSMPTKSGAGLELEYSTETGLRIRCMALASFDDLELALHLAKAFMDGRPERVRPEDAEYDDEVDLDRRFDRAWASAQLRAGANLVLSFKGDTIAAVQTTLRPFYVGPRMRERILGTESPPERLLAALTRFGDLAHGVRDACYPATIQTADGIGTLTAWNPSIPYLFHPVDVLGVIGPTAGQRILLVPWDEAPALAFGGFERPDELHLLVNALSEAQQAEFHRAARAVARVRD